MLKKILASSLFKSSGIYTVTNIINSAIPFLMMPILTRYLNPVDYGIVSMFQVLIGLVAPFTGLSINGAINRQYYERDKIDFPKYVTNALFLLLTSTFFIAVIFWIFAHPISQISSFPEKWLWAVIIVSFFQFIISITLVQWQVKVKPVFYGIFQISNTLLNISLSLLFVVGMGFDWEGRIQGQVITVVLFGIAAFIILKKNGWIKWGIEKEYIKHAVSFGVPIIPHALGTYVINMIDRLFITNMVGVAETGIYSVGYQFGYIISLFADSFNKAWVPWLFERLKLDQAEIKRKIVKFTYLYFILIILAALALSAFAPWFLDFFIGEKFSEASKYVFWVALGYSFNGMYKMVTNYVFYAQKTHILAWMTFFTAVVNIILNYFLISWNGAIGAAQATAISFFMTFILTWILSSRVYKMPWSLK